MALTVVFFTGTSRRGAVSATLAQYSKCIPTRAVLEKGVSFSSSGFAPAEAVRAQRLLLSGHDSIGDGVPVPALSLEQTTLRS